MIGRAAALAALLAAAGCASAPPDRYEPRLVRGHGMSPYVVHGACLRAAAGERIEYYFTSTFPIDFSIRYEEGGAVVMPISRAATLEDSAVFTAPIDHRYCLTWEAASTGATLDYGLRLRPPVAP